MERILLISLFLFSWLNLYSQQGTAVDLPRKALETIVKNLKEGDGELKAYAIEALGETGNKRVIPVVKKYLKDNNGYVRIAAAKTLWMLEDKDGIEELYAVINEAPSQSPVNDPLVELKNIAENKIREKAIETVTAILGEKAKDFLIKIKSSDSYAVIRDVASRELAALGEKEDLDGFYSGLSSPDEETRIQTAEIFSKICPLDSSKILEFLKKEKSSKVKMFLLESLRCSVSSKAAATELLKYADDKNPTIRYKAVISMSRYLREDTLSKLQTIYSDTPDANLKVAAMIALLARKKIKPDYEEITEIFSYADSDIKRKLVAASDFLDDARAQTFLTMAMQDKDPYCALDASVRIIKRSKKKDL
ncbi:MAG: hypothetical protein Fur0012_13520 [Elusimicrobiota bacterium]